MYPLDCPLPYVLLSALCLCQDPEQRPSFAFIASMFQGMLGRLRSGSMSYGSHNRRPNHEFSKQGGLMSGEAAVAML